MDGLASQLGARADLVQLSVVRARAEPDDDEIRATRPAVIMLDAADGLVRTTWPLGRLLDLLPDVCIVRLDHGGQRAQVICSRRQPAGQTSELLALIQKLSAARSAPVG